MPDQLTINNRLANLGWTGLPVDAIVNQPGHPLAGINNKSQLWEDLNENVCRHARANNWVWIPTNGNNGDRNFVGPLGGPLRPHARPNAGTLGIPLLDGSNNQRSCNCGVFNTVVRQIAWHILGFQDNEIAAAFTDKTFATLPGSAGQSYDAAWTGNIRTVASDFHVIGAYKFTGHSFSSHPAGGFSDATCSVRHFQQKPEIFWFEATKTDRKSVMTFFKVSTIHNAQNQMPPGGAPYFLIAAELLKTAKQCFRPAGAGLTRAAIDNVPDYCATRVEWPNFWLLSLGDVNMEFMNFTSAYFSAL